MTSDEGVVSTSLPVSALGWVNALAAGVAMGTMLWWLEWQMTLRTFPAVRPALAALADTRRQLREAREVCQQFEREVAGW